GFSYVDLVEGLRDGRFYALKRILCHDKEDRQAALHEVEMHDLFDHPNILRLVAPEGWRGAQWALGDVHPCRDLKPTNVLLDEDDRPVLMDLGSMNQARIEVNSSREAMAVQSLGCVLYCMMFGEGPYDAIFQKGDSVALAVQNPITLPPTTRYSAALQRLLSSMMTLNHQAP
ncbi:Serine/threonine-protein kinase 16, partial [Podiceps cristatus]